MFHANTSHPACPVRIMYTEVMTGDSLHAAELDHHQWRRPSRPLAIIRCTEYSDYSGSAVERSNYRVILGETRRPGLVQISGSHGYQALAYDATLGPIPADEELYQMLEGVDNYALPDDEDHSELETEMEAEAWEDHGKGDFKRALVYVLDAFDDDGGNETSHEHELPDDDTTCTMSNTIDSVAATWGEFWWDLWRHGCDEFSVNGGSGFQIETGGGVHFYVDEWVKRAVDMERTNPSEARRRLQIAFRHIGEACRSGAE